MCNERRILLIIGGGIAAYKCLELIRRGRERGLAFRCVLTAAASQFVTPLSVASLAGEKVYDQLFSLTDEAEMGHIRLSREADLVVVAPATADLMAKMAAGLADDLASTLLLASDKPVLVAPAMNPQMWSHPATRRNLARLAEDGVHLVGPESRRHGLRRGRLRAAWPSRTRSWPRSRPLLAPAARPLVGMRAIVTSGPTREPLDPVRFLSNHSSGRQGHAIARALAEAGATVALVSGPVAEPDPPGVARRACGDRARDARGGGGCPAGRDRRLCRGGGRLAAGRGERGQDQEARGRSTARDRAGREPGHPADAGRAMRGVRASSSASPPRPATSRQRARAKLARKGCDWILANDVSTGTGVFGGERNRILLLTGPGPAEAWPELDKTAVARRLVERIAATLAGSVVHA